MSVEDRSPLPARPPAFKPHPWHGISIGPDAPRVVRAFVEIVPTDTVKYEIDKPTGYLRLDRPQRYSNVCPSLYGFVPRTLCGDRIGALCADRTGREGIAGDGDPMDICILTEKSIQHGDLLVDAIPIGGFRMIDGNEADDKVIAVLKDDAVYGSWRAITDCPRSLVDRLRHYFLTYKEAPGSANRITEIAKIYDAEEARLVIETSREDYRARFGDPGE